jgi:hypothetical protein
MYKLKIIFLLCLLIQLSCSSGGPLTPAESFNAIKRAVEKNDGEAIAGHLTQSSLDKFNKLNLLIKEMRSDQLALLSDKYGYPPEKLKTLKVSDSVSLYFFSDITAVKLSRYFKESIISINIQGSRALIKTESGIELDFLREGPYWKFDLSDL